MCILADGSFVFAVTDFRLLNVANLTVQLGTVFVIRGDEIKDHLRVKAEQETLAVGCIGLRPVIPVESCQFVRSAT